MMKRISRKLVILLLAGTILSAASAEGNRYVGLLRKLDYGEAVTYVIGHKSPDPERTERSRRYLLELSETKPVYAIPEEDTICVEDGRVRFIGDRPYYEFAGGTVTEREPGSGKAIG